jgi:cytidylate kinase
MTEAQQSRRIAIDGPAASGKSAVGTAVARALGFRFIDTGSIYRALTWLALAAGLDPEQAEAISDLAASAAISVREAPDGGSAVTINGRDVSSELRSTGVEAAVSAVSAIPAVRRHLLAVQRALATDRVVMAGRDIGTVVLPDAELKIFLDASPEERARRRLAEMQAEQRSLPTDVLGQLTRRDQMDSTRSAAPLTVPAGAVRLQTDAMPLAAVIAAVLAQARTRWPDLRDNPEESAAR